VTGMQHVKSAEGDADFLAGGFKTFNFIEYHTVYVYLIN
jgi:hypothetical protein